MPNVELQPGSSNIAGVKQLQDYLVQKGFLTDAQKNTGYGTYGPQTTAAVLALQKSLGIDYSSGPGYFGPKTIAALSGSGAPSTPAIPQSSAAPAYSFSAAPATPIYTAPAAYTSPVSSTTPAVIKTQNNGYNNVSAADAAALSANGVNANDWNSELNVNGGQYAQSWLSQARQKAGTPSNPDASGTDGNPNQIAQYTIKQGDTLSALATRYGTTVNNLMTLNPNLRDPNFIRTGDALNLPVTPAYLASAAALGGGANSNQASQIGTAVASGSTGSTGLPKNIGSILGAPTTPPNVNTAIPVASLPSTGNPQLDQILNAGIQNGTLDSSIAGILSLLSASSPGEATVKDATDKLISAMTSLGNEGADLQTALNAQGVPDAVAHAKQLNLDVAQLKGQIDAFDAETLQGRANIEGQQIPIGLVQGQQAAFQKQRDLTKLGMTAELTAKTALLQAYQGNVDMGMKLAQQAVEMQYSIIKNNIEVYKTQLDAAKSTLSEQDKKKSDIITVLLKQVDANLADAKTNASKTQTLVIQAASNGAPPNVVAAMSAAGDPVRAAQIGASYIKGNLESVAKNGVSSTGGAGTTGNFTTTQINNGAQNAGLPVADFKTIPADAQNFFINAPQATINTLNSVFSDVADGSKSIADANTWIDSSNITPAFNAYLKQRVASLPQAAAGGGSGWGSQALSWLGGAWNSVASFFGL